MRNPLEEMEHPLPPTSVETNNTAENSTVNGMETKIYISRATDMLFYLVHRRIRQNIFHIFWEEGN